VLLCSSQRANRAAREHEVLLNGADGLDWETLIRCDLMYLMERDEIYGRRSVVTPVRRRAIVQRLNGAFGFTLV
jgi:hypothetical protein